MELFNRQDTRSFTNGNTDTLDREISQISDSDILSLNIDELVDYYYSKYSIDIIRLLINDISPTIEETKIEEPNPFYDRYTTLGFESRTFSVDGYKVNYKIPFEGNISLLYLKPTMSILSSFFIDNIENENSKEYLPSICLSIKIKSSELKGKDNPQEIIDNTFNKEFKYYEQMIGYVNNDINAYNSSLKEHILGQLEKRKEKSSNLSSLLSRINIPLKSSVNATNTTPISLSVKKEIKKYPEKKSEIFEDYSIKDEDYNNIKKIINQACISYERTAGTINKLEEEEIRDLLLANLNTHYDSLATGEAFSKTGKTDIRIQFNNKAAYIAECKIWHGASEFNKAIDQLFGYITWRDVKTSLIIFNKNNKDFQALLQKINDELLNNKLCVSCKKTSTNNWQCTFRKNMESDEKVELNVIVCDISIS